MRCDHPLARHTLAKGLKRCRPDQVLILVEDGHDGFLMCTSEHADESPDACKAAQVTSPSFRLCRVENFHFKKSSHCFCLKKERKGGN